MACPPDVRSGAEDAHRLSEGLGEAGRGRCTFLGRTEGRPNLVLADAVEEGIIPSNPAAKRRGRGKRVGRSQHRGAEKAITTALGVLLIAERAALLSGRDDEFVAVVTMGFTGLRWGEIVGLEPQYVRGPGIRVEWQLYELDNGILHRCPPKDESRRTVAAPGWLVGLVKDHIASTRPAP